MASALRPYRRRGHVTLDWLLIAVGLAAGALLAGAVIRTGDGGQSARFGTHIGGVRSLSDTDRLVAFEDMSTGATGWSGGARNDDHLGLGAIWLAEPGTALTRDIALPDGTVRAVLSLDLIAIDDWALEGLEIALDGAPILRHRFTTRPDLDRLDPPANRSADLVAVRAQTEPPREMGFASGTPALEDERLTVEIAVTTPGTQLALSITPLPAEDGDNDAPAPLWAVDNLVVVAESLP